MQPPAGSQVSRVPAQRTPSEQLPPAPPTPTPQPPRRRMRTVLIVVAGVLALVTAGAAITGYVLYDRATKPDRSAPDVVVDNYLRAFLVDRNDVKADLYTCKGGAQLEALRALRDDIHSREQQLGVTILVSWGSLDGDNQDGSASITTVIRRSASVDGVQQSLADTWRFDVEEQQDGWRVCGGGKGN
ncbi:hypothetical protein [Micromonospora tarensis]|uniref:Mce-associated membrane protein n=1 Tax=Micromonospora tarensis TaxID=2806100 RepID=A0ABS1YNU3_9ACTN|nr:hypothetical protein [Micromonospora tarensis]MBM0278967.1 hypothetical protein [Micromonospora tarensis]